MSFPHVRQDGTFDIVLEFSSDRPVERDVVDDWLASWLQANDPWERNWIGAGGEVVKVDRLRYADAFVAAPRIISVAASAISIELIGWGASAYWKDWMVRLIEEAIKDLELKFDRAVDSDPPPSEA